MVFHPGDNRQLHDIPPERRLPAPWTQLQVLTRRTSVVESDLTSGFSGRASRSTQNRLTNLAARGKAPRDDNLWHPRNVRESALETLQRWETAGGHWEVLSHSPAG